MAPAKLLDRNVRPSRVREHESEDQERTSRVSGMSDDQDGKLEDEESDGGEDSDGEDVEAQINRVSFVSLMQAQKVLSGKRRRNSDSDAEQDEKLNAIRARLHEIKSDVKRRKLAETDEKQRDAALERAVDDDDSSDSAPSEEEKPSRSRTSKHAPAAQSSKHQVTRKRIVVDIPKRLIRDPRFDAIQQRSAHPGNTDKAYSFLRDYQESEIAELRSAIKQTRNEDDKETLRRKMVSMQNRLKSKDAKEREQEVLRRHRKEEKGRVEQGKKPFFLKKKELKERALVERFKGMKGKEREKLMERRKLKEGQREKKKMPETRRGLVED